jgi:dihydroorotate dehydrogenase
MYRLLLPLLNQIDPEAFHSGLRDLARLSHLPGVKPFVRAVYDFQDSRLTQEYFGMTFRNPVGLAAGFDKYGSFLTIAPEIGFGFMELGSITAQPRLGSPQPRLFRLPQDNALIHRMGLNNDGAEATKNTLTRATGKRQIPLGINIAKTHDPNIIGEAAVADQVKCYTQLAPLADYIALNLSCPNTADGKTFEDAIALEQLLIALQVTTAQLMEEHQHVPPLFVKMSPDLTDTELVRLVQVCEQFQVAGYIVSNTSTKREGLHTPQVKLHEIGIGGLSGAPLFERSLKMIRMIRNLQPTAFIIGVGGVQSAASAYALLRAGASLLQVYTGLYYNGPALVKQINRGILHRLEADGYSHISEAIGSQ